MEILVLFCLLVSTAESSTASSTTTKSVSASCAATTPQQPPHHDGRLVLEAILANDYAAFDDAEQESKPLSECLNALKNRGAHRCWHKHSTFLDHLLGVHNILRLWGESVTVGLVGLFHSAYSNSYVNLALYDPQTERKIMQELIGNKAEDLVYMYCIIDRQEVVVNTLLKNGYIPKDGLYVPHLRYPDDESKRVYLSPETLRMLVVFTMADTADQYFGWQDQLFGGGGDQGSMIIPGKDFGPSNHDATALWPGVSRPGLWMSYISELAKVARTFYDDGATHDSPSMPPVFAGGTETLSVEDEAAARDLYWSVVSGQVTDREQVRKTLEECSRKNPWAFEPLVLLAQCHIHRNDFEATLRVTSRALELQQQWGTAWDKRLAFSAWVAWTRVLHQRAQEQTPWPVNSWEVNNLGLVR